MSGQAPSGPDPVPVPAALAAALAPTRDGEVWLRRLPVLVDRARTRWGLRLEPPFEGGRAAWTAPARTADGDDAVVKIVFPHPETAGEAVALRAWAGRGAAELLDLDAGAATLLLRRCRPGHSLAEDRPLAEGRNETRLELAGELLGMLHGVGADVGGANPSGVADLADVATGWAQLLRERLQRHATTLEADRGLVAEAATLLEELPAGAGRRVLLHGDYNPGNVLARDADGDRWVAIDPKPMTGDPAYDPWPMLSQLGDPVAGEGTAALRARTRVLCAAAGGLEPDRVAAWSLARSCESALWRAAELGDRTGALTELAEAKAWARLV
ncbi:aminoglycoside phosphotransferase family protein [Georgenia sp. AZ-5]|uniref:aminoglycoside phosphotransferase family protein n=1 Tax=Georgenia sp. AZ-5 TaxID=3367526 RepID=UPI003754BD42